MFDVVTIGSATLDVFVESDDANIVSVYSKTKRSDYMSFPYGSKVEITDFSRNLGGGAINTAINFQNLGLKTTTIVKTGHDEMAPLIETKIESMGVDTSNIIHSKSGLTGFSIILVSFQGDRTVLAHRGANAKITEKDIDFEKLKNVKWIYIAPLSGESNKLLDKIALFAKENNIKLALNAGTTAIKKGEAYFKKIISSCNILILNKEEASLLTKIEVRPDTKTEFYSKEIIHPDFKRMLKALRNENNSIVLITDGKNGAIAYDGKQYYKAPEFPAKVRSTLGAGDAFSSTFVASMEKFNNDIAKSIKYASVNSAACVEVFGAQEGLITFDEMNSRLEKNPDYKVQIICG
ncbi:MAG: carbohydrate kinase family protein [Candidatus Gastranaerophilales bacterium]|nr:carbohydrate kinase family protein [Candidatus Gastranaerophilales bacterium]